MEQTPSDALVLFGATGDLAHKKLYPALYSLEASGKLGIPVIGVAATDWDDVALRHRAEESIRGFFESMTEKGTVGEGEQLDEEVLARLLGNISMVAGDYREKATFERLAERLKGAESPLHYLAIPPFLFEVVIQSLQDVGLAEGARVVVEKPFGRNRSSAEVLNTQLHQVFPEQSIFRIDHFLGKDAVWNIMVLRTENIFANLWDRDNIESVAITMAESFSVEGRGAFYDAVGAIRDVVQNHLLEVVALLAMETPVSLDAARIADEKVKLLRAVREINPADVVRGQYRTYRDEEGVEPWSTTETFVAMRLHIDNMRWAGVPFFVRTGKSLERTATEAVVTFKRPPIALFGDNAPNQLRFNLTGTGQITFDLVRKAPDALSGAPVRLTVAAGSDAVALPQDAYARLLRDATLGRKERFARADAVDQAWRVVDPILGLEPVELYEAGTWGPREALALTDGYTPWPTSL